MSTPRSNSNKPADIVLDWNLAKRAAGGDQPPRKVIVFPLARRDAIVTDIASEMMMEPDAGAAQRHLIEQLSRHGNMLRRRGASASVVDRQLKSLEAAIRAKLWRWLFGPWPQGGAR